MSERNNDGPTSKPPSLSVVDGGRDVLERELLWLIALGGDAKRVEELMRILGPAANDGLRLTRASDRSVGSNDEWDD